MFLPYFAVCTATAMLVSLWKKGNQNTKKVKINCIQYGDEEIPRDERCTVLHLSDLHLELNSVTPERLQALLKDKPFDLVVFTGDFLDRAKSIPKLVPFLRAIRALKPDVPMYAVLGNHDYVLKGAQLKALISTLNSTAARCSAMKT